MDSVVHVLRLWEDEGVIVAIILSGVVLLHSVSRLLGARLETALAALLTASVGIAAGGIWMLHFFGLGLSARASWFAGLYVWCALGMIFFAHRTHYAKLIAALAAQAGIVYALFVLL